MTKDEKIRDILDKNLSITCSNPPVERFVRPQDLGLKIIGIDTCITQLKSLNKIDERWLVGIMKDAHYLWLENKANTDNILDWYAHEIVKRLEER